MVTGAARRFILLALGTLVLRTAAWSQTPSLTSLSPSSVTAGSSAFTLTVDGSGFFPQRAMVSFNGTALSTNFVSTGEVTATVPASLVSTAGIYPVTVSNGPGFE